MSGLDTSQAITDEVSLHAAEHHAHSLPHDEAEPADAEQPAPPAAPVGDGEQQQASQA